MNDKLLFFAISTVGVVLLGCSSEAVRPAVTHAPRFTHDPQDHPVPDDRGNYPGSWDTAMKDEIARCAKFGQWLAGVDWQQVYRPRGRTLRDTERIVQRVTLTRNVADCGGNTRTTDRTIVEMFNPARNFDTLSAFECTEVDINVSWVGEVGIVDLEELDDELVARIPEFGAKQNAIIFSDNDVPEYLTTDQVDDLEDAIDEAGLTWRVTYTYAGCNDNFHDWTWSWEDSDGGGGNRRANSGG